jgi:hypothetical protein
MTHHNQTKELTTWFLTFDLGRGTRPGVPSRWHMQRTVVTTLTGHAWICDIEGALTIPMIIQYLQLRAMIQEVILTPGVSDKIIWRWSASG